MKNFILSTICLAIASLGFSQETIHYDNIYAKGGSFFRGVIIDTIDNVLQIQLSETGAITTIPLDAVASVQKESEGFQFLKNGRTAKSEGMYFSIAFDYLTARAAPGHWDTNRTGGGLHFAVGTYIRPWLSAGVGIGLDGYQELIMPVVGEVRLVSQKWNRAPYFSLRAGHGLMPDLLFHRDEFDESRGGLIWHPSVGIRFATRRKTEIFADLGYKFQSYTYEYDYPDDWWYSNITERRRYQSLAFRFGVQF